MSTKLLIYLLLVAVVSTKEYTESEHDHPVAYSSVYRSFDTNIDNKEEKKTEDVKTNSPISDEKTSSPVVYEVIENQQNNNDAEQEQKDAAMENTANNPPINQGSIIYSIPNVKTAPNVNSAVPVAPPTSVGSVASATNNGKTSSVPYFSPGATNPPFSPDYVGEGRLITPGLSAFATSGEELENESAKITIVDSKVAQPATDAKSSPAQANIEAPKESSDTDKSADNSQKSDSDTESHASFEGFGTNYSW